MTNLAMKVIVSWCVVFVFRGAVVVSVRLWGYVRLGSM